MHFGGVLAYQNPYYQRNPRRNTVTKVELPTSANILAKSRNAGMKPAAYWRATIPDLIRTLTTHYKTQMRERAFEIGIDIIPYQRMDSELFPKFMVNPHAAPYDTLVEEYGVSRRYVALAYLRAYERYLAKNPDALAKLDALDPISMTRRHRVFLTETILRTNMTKEFMEEAVKMSPMPNTIEMLLRGAPAQTKARMQKLADEQARIDARLEKKREENKRYDGTTRAVWRHARTQTVTSKAKAIADALIANSTDAQAVPVLVLLAGLARPQSIPTTVWRARPAALLIYAHKHLAHLIPASLLDEITQQAHTVLEQAKRYRNDSKATLTEKHILAAVANTRPYSPPYSAPLNERDLRLVSDFMRANLPKVLPESAPNENNCLDFHTQTAYNGG